MPRTGDKLASLMKLSIPDTVRKELSGTGMLFFYDLVKRHGIFLTDAKLLEVVRDLWDCKDNCFYVGENTLFFGIDSILITSGVKFSGTVVRIKKDDAYPVGEADADGKVHVEGLGRVDKKFIDGNSIKFAWLEDFFKDVNADFDHLVNAYVLYILGTSIYSNSGRKVQLKLLEFIKDGAYKKHSWGLVLLTNMYYFLNKRGDYISTVGRYLLMVFFFEHLPGLRDAFFRNKDTTEVLFPDAMSLPTGFPLGMSWASHVTSVLKNKHRIEIEYKSIIENSEITRNAYARLGEDFLPGELFREFEMRFYRGPLIHPNHNPCKGFHHRPDLCPEHFGLTNGEVRKDIPKIVYPYNDRDFSKREAQWYNWKGHLMTLQNDANPNSQPSNLSPASYVAYVTVDCVDAGYTQNEVLGSLQNSAVHDTSPKEQAQVFEVPVLDASPNEQGPVFEGTSFAAYPEMGDPAGQSSSNPSAELHGDEFWPLSGKPFFDIIMSKSHVNPKYQMMIPAKLHPILPSCEVPAVLKFGGKTWEMTCNAASKTHKLFDKFSWKAFVDDNNLKEGDGCVFELMECSITKLVFRVQILRGDIPAELVDKYSGENAENPIVI